MNFDQNNPAPAIQPGKKTTQVNLWMAAFVIFFLALGIIGIVWCQHHREQTANSVDQKVNPTTSPSAQ